MPESWLKKAIRNASEIMIVCFELKKDTDFPAGDSYRLPFIIDAISASASSTPISNKVSFAFVRLFFFVINQRGLSGTPITITV